MSAKKKAKKRRRNPREAWARSQAIAQAIRAVADVVRLYFDLMQ